MTKVIINADDYGYSRGINLAIIDSHKLGILTSGTIMAGMPGFEDAVRLAKENPSFGVGVHLTLTCGYPVLSGHKTIVTETGAFRKQPQYYHANNDYDTDEILREWDAQIKKVIDAGIQPTHLDSHHHIHTLPQHQPIFLELARKYNLPVRGNFDVPEDIKTIQHFETRFDDTSLKEEDNLKPYLDELMEKFEKYDTVEIMTHPGYLDSEVYFGSSMLEQRMLVTDFLIHSKFAKALKENPNIELVTYRDI